MQKLLNIKIDGRAAFLAPKKVRRIDLSDYGLRFRCGHVHSVDYARMLEKFEQQFVELAATTAFVPFWNF